MSVAAGATTIYTSGGTTYTRKGGNGTITIGNISSGSFINDES